MKCTSWNFILWGAWWGLWLVIWRQFERFVPGLAKSPGKFPTLLRWAFTFLLMNIGWLMFREQNLHELVRQLSANPFTAPANDWRIGRFIVVLMILYSLPLWIHTALETRIIAQWHTLRDTNGGFILQTLGGVSLMLLLLLMSSKVSSDFIYFQF